MNQRLRAHRARPPALVALVVPLACVAIRPAGSAAQVSDGRDLPVREHVLENGMRFLLLRRPGVPTVSFVVHVPVGSVNESPGNTGTSHLIEHLLFKGTTTVGTRDPQAERRLFAVMDAAQDSIDRLRGAPGEADEGEIERLESRIAVLEDSARALAIPNEYDEIFTRNGARGLNASTGYEATQYVVSLPSNRAKLWFLMEADRLRNPVFRDFYTERDVVAEERRSRIDTSPAGLLLEAQLAAAFRIHPYGVLPIGRMDDIRSLTRPAVEAYFAKYYGPGNTTVAIVGDFDPDSAVVWAEEYFGPMEPGDPPPPVRDREPRQREERRVEILFDAEPQLRIGWKIPAATHPDAPALGVLANILVGGRDARLYKRLVRDERIATSVLAGTGPGELYPGLFTIQAIPRAPHTTEEVEAAIYDELDRLRVEPPTRDELARVRTQLQAAEVRRLVSNEGIAYQLVSSQAMWGDWRETFRLQDRMSEVEADDVLGVLDRYIRDDTRTVAVLHRPPGAGS